MSSCYWQEEFVVVSRQEQRPTNWQTTVNGQHPHCAHLQKATPNQVDKAVLFLSTATPSKTTLFPGGRYVSISG